MGICSQLWEATNPMHGWSFEVSLLFLLVKRLWPSWAVNGASGQKEVEDKSCFTQATGYHAGSTRDGVGLCVLSGEGAHHISFCSETRTQ